MSIHSPVYDSPGSPVLIIPTAQAASSFEVSVDGRAGECFGQTWAHPEGTSQTCWITLPRSAGQHTITATAHLHDRYGVGTQPIDARGPVAAPVDDATRERILTCGNTSKQVWLTFDDGFLSEQAMHRVLGTLETENVQARFFATGQWSRANPAMTSALQRAGHLVENHTDTHESLNAIGDAELQRQIARGPATGASLVRPGFGAGAFTARISNAAAREGQQVCYWTVDPRDWAKPEAGQLIRRVIEGDQRTPPAQPGGVVLLHMTGAHTPEALPQLIRELRAKGLSLPPLHERATP